MSMNAFQVGYWITVLSDGNRQTSLDEADETAFLRLIRLIDRLAPVGNDNRREYWLKVPRGSLEEFREYYDEEASEEEVREVMLIEYPDEISWYKVCSVHHKGLRNREFYGLFLNGKYILSLNDANGYNCRIEGISELLVWLTEETKKVITELENGTYNARIAKELPASYKYGLISRKDYWDIYPELRREYRDCFGDKKIRKFLEYAENFEGDRISGDCLPSMTARQYYEACLTGYLAIGLKPRSSCLFQDTEEEHRRYGGITPKEVYYKYADGRDDGMQKVPLDDAEAFGEWLDQKGEYYEFNGHHPWEIIPSMSTEFSLHLYVGKVREEDSVKGGYYFSLSGSTFDRSRDTVLFYLALREAGLPVRLYEGEKLSARFRENDLIGIVPETVRLYHTHSVMGKDVPDAVHLSDGGTPEFVAEKAFWEEPECCSLL